MTARNPSPDRFERWQTISLAIFKLSPLILSLANGFGLHFGVYRGFDPSLRYLSRVKRNTDPLVRIRKSVRRILSRGEIGSILSFISTRLRYLSIVESNY